MKSVTKILKPMRKSLMTVLLILIIAGTASAQSYNNARSNALGGSFTAISRGVFSVGFNPANLALPSEYKSYITLYGLNSYATNNFYSLMTSAKYGGKDLTADNKKLQKELLSELPADGWRSSIGLNMPVPLISFSSGNKAFTANLLYVTDYYVSKPMLDLIFGNLQKGVNYQLDLRCDALTAMEYAYSMGIPYENMSFGFSIKYYQGLGYYGLDPDHRTGSVMVDTANFILKGSGDYVFRQSTQGRGFGLDFGVAFQDLGGWQVGISLINLGSSIRWNTETMVSKTLKDWPLNTMGWLITNGYMKNSDVDLDFAGESYKYSFEINNVNKDNFLEGDSSYGDYFVSHRKIVTDSTVFTTRLPLVLRVGLGKQIRPDLLVAADFAASFQESLNYWKGWRTSVGIEYSYFKKIPFRMGFALGGLSGYEIDLGTGFNLGFAHFDWSIGFHRGVWIHTVQGLNFSLGAYFTGKTKK